MGWMTFRRWLAQIRADVERERGRSQTSPQSWAGREHDAFWKTR